MGEKHGVENHEGWAVAQPTAKRTREPAQGSDISHEDSNERTVHIQRSTSRSRPNALERNPVQTARNPNAVILQKSIT